MKTKSIETSFLAIVVGSMLSLATAQSQIVLDFTNASGTFSPETIALSSLVDGTPTDTGPNMSSRLSVSGSLTGLTDNTDSFDIAYSAYAASTLTGTDISVSSEDILASNARGISIRNGDMKVDDGDGLSFTFDLTNFDPGYNLVITGFTVTSSDDTYDDGQDAQMIIDNESVTNLGTNVSSISGLNLEVSNGDFVYWRNVGTGGAYRLTTLTLDTVAIPEPSTALLLGIGGGLLCLLRRKR